jgi:hypothetical protein
MQKQWIDPEAKGQLVTAGRATEKKRVERIVCCVTRSSDALSRAVIHHEAEKIEALEPVLHSTTDQVKYPFKVDTITAGTQSTHQCVTRVSGYSTSSQHRTAPYYSPQCVAQQYSVPGRSRQWSHSLVLLHTMNVLCCACCPPAITSPRPQAASLKTSRNTPVRLSSLTLENP